MRSNAHSHGERCLPVYLGTGETAKARKKWSVPTANVSVTTGSIRERRGTGAEVGGEGRRYFCNRVVKYYRENTVPCAYVPKADLTSILRG